MSEHPKIRAQHLERQAYIYIRQSTLQQVTQHLESQALQYQLVQRAQALGWSEGQVVVIDDDLGKSAISASDRRGFQALVTAVGMAQVGIILATDVSRLARNCSDWYRLLDLSSMFGTLIGDASEVYDPRDYNDRLLLGLEGTISEAHWHNMRRQLHTALLNKAQRGELAIRLPVGYDRDEEGQVVLCPDQEVQNAIGMVFDQFERLGSARAVLLYFRERQLELPRRIQFWADQGEIEWVEASYQAIYRMLTHPAYAGAYTYGKKRRVRLPGNEGKVVIRDVPLEEWAVLRRNAFPGYISWDRYLKNRARLRENGQNTNWSKGTARSGRALLQGIVLCGRCGRRVHTRYSNHPAYVCEVAANMYGGPVCQTFTVAHIDEAVVEVFLEAIQPAHLEAALAALEQVETQRQKLVNRWEQHLERARYQAELARRRYERVDPDNRLVAAELERRWEDKLQTLQRLEKEWEQAQEQELTPLTETDRAMIRELAADVPALWHAETTTMAERKRLLRCLIQDVTLDAVTKPGFSIIRLRWHTGTTTVLQVERPKAGCRTASEVVAQIRELAQHHTDDQIADMLNADEITTATGKTWNQRRVESVRKKYKIATACPYYTEAKGPRGDGLIAAPEAAERLGVSSSMVSYWFRRGLIVGVQRKRGSDVWVRLTEEDVPRLDGSMSLQPDMVEIHEAARLLGTPFEQVTEEIRAQRLISYRLLVNNRWQWYVRLPTEQVDRAAAR
jgi:DNA invertase Pin-like site-specific DNA recombinase